MKKILLLSIITLLLSAACNRSKPELEELSGYTELSEYNGGIVTSKMWQTVDRRKEYALGVRLPGANMSHCVDVDKEIFDMYDIGDTIQMTSQYEYYADEQTNSTEVTDATVMEIQSLQRERTQIVSAVQDAPVNKPASDGLGYSAVILIDNKPYMITMKEIK